MQLKDAGASWAILGHSERRGGDGETDESVNRKVHAALRWGIRAIVCVGESEADHAAGITHRHVIAQTQAAFEDVDPADIAQCVVAYEPIWAIGSGQQRYAGIRERRARSDSRRRARPRTRADALRRQREAINIAKFLDQPNIDGALVGTASLEPRSFADVLSGASHVHIQ